jgi:hypothetical protein
MMGIMLVLVVLHVAVAYIPVRGHFKRHQAVRPNLHRSGEPPTTTTAHHGRKMGDTDVSMDAAAVFPTASRNIIVEVSARRPISRSSATARAREGLAFDTVYKVAPCSAMQHHIGRTMRQNESPYEAL